MDSKLHELLELLSEDEYITSRHLAEKLSIRKKLFEQELSSFQRCFLNMEQRLSQKDILVIG